ncbi:hypothetical protein [Streptomyces tremellae]
MSTPQFNREYRSAYGLPPGQDATRLRSGLTSRAEAGAARGARRSSG